MFVVCFSVACTVFVSVELREYPAFAGELNSDPAVQPAELREYPRSLPASLSSAAGATAQSPMLALLFLVAGALAATLTELHEPFGLNDNLTIPIFSSLAMQWAFSRIQG
jgi:hypothetical protein